MLLVNNINILKYLNQNTLNKLKDVEGNMNESSIKVEESKKGNKTLFTENEGNKTYIHSKYNPIREAESIIEEYKEIEENTTVIFYGTGLGYHINLFLEKYPNVDYYIYEPIPELLYTYLSNKSIKDLPYKRLKNIIVDNCTDETINFLNNVVDKKKGEVLLIELPIHKKIFLKEYEKFVDLFKKILRGKRSNLHTNYAFQKRWITNGMKNFREVLFTPNVLLSKPEHFKDKPAIIVASGPSLNEEIENLKVIKEKGLAYIFSVGSAITILVNNGIYPDATCSYDPGETQYLTHENMREKNITTIPLIFGSTVGVTTVQKYPGRKLHMITSQDTTASFYLKSNTDKDIEVVLDAPSIAVVTLQMLYKLGCNPILLVGQNLAYKGNARYAEGQRSGLEHLDLDEQKKKKSIQVKDVYGNYIYTAENLNNFRLAFERYINQNKKVKVINTTKGGANIEGTEFIPLEDLIENNLKENVVDHSWSDIDNDCYDLEYLVNKTKKMKKESEELEELIYEVNDVLKKIQNLCNNNNFSHIENMYHKLDKSFKNLQENSYFKHFLLPMNRVYYELLVLEVNKVKEDQNQKLKAVKIIEQYKKFIYLCKKDRTNSLIAFDTINRAIKEKITNIGISN